MAIQTAFKKHQAFWIASGSGIHIIGLVGFCVARFVVARKAFFPFALRHCWVGGHKTCFLQVDDRHIYSTLTQTCDEICLLEEGGFKQQVLKANFDTLEESMHQEIVGNAVNLLDW